MKQQPALYSVTSDQEKEIFEVLGEKLGSVFKDRLYYDFKLTYHRGLLVPFAHHLEEAYLKRSVLSHALIESIMAVAMFNCDNKYCYLFHTGELLKLGYTEKDIFNLTENFTLPKDFPEKEKWETVLRLTHFIFRRDAFVVEVNQNVRSFLSEEEYDHYNHVLFLANFLFQMLLTYDEELDIKNEPLFKVADSDEFLDYVKNALKYVEWQDSRGKDHKLLTICSFCKNIKTKDDDWIPVEKALRSDLLDATTEFSHGICQTCFDDRIKDNIEMD